LNSRYLDDLIPGERFTTRGVTLTEGSIVDFAWRYDPQPFHLDKEAAAGSHYGGLIASGLQTLAVCFRLLLETGVFHEASIGSPGFDELRWLAPVRPGDTIHTEAEVVDIRPSASKPDRGIARLRYRALNQHGHAVLSFTMMHLLLRRTAPGSR